MLRAFLSRPMQMSFPCSKSKCNQAAARECVRLMCAKCCRRRDLLCGRHSAGPFVVSRRLVAERCRLFALRNKLERMERDLEEAKRCSRAFRRHASLAPLLELAANLPHDVLVKIMSHFDLRTRAKLACLCRPLRDAHRDPSSWKRIALSPWDDTLPEGYGEAARAAIKRGVACEFFHPAPRSCNWVWRGDGDGDEYADLVVRVEGLTVAFVPEEFFDFWWTAPQLRFDELDIIYTPSGVSRPGSQREASDKEVRERAVAVAERCETVTLFLDRDDETGGAHSFVTYGDEEEQEDQLEPGREWTEIENGRLTVCFL